MADAGTNAVNCVLVTKFVDRFCPLNWMRVPRTNPTPFTVSMNAGPLSIAVAGDCQKFVDTGAPLVIANIRAFESRSPGLQTITLALPPTTIRLADTEAVNWEVLINVVGRVAPFHCTSEPDTKPLP